MPDAVKLAEALIELAYRCDEAHGREGLRVVPLYGGTGQELGAAKIELGEGASVKGDAAELAKCLLELADD